MRTLAISSILLASILSTAPVQAQSSAYTPPPVQIINNNPKLSSAAATAAYNKAYDDCIADKTITDDSSYLKCLNGELAKNKLVAEKSG